MKRYAIVRVDGEFSCPSQYENIEDEYVCKNGCYPKRSCNNGKVLYGDTKEQLIKKVAQVIRRYRKNLEDCEYCDMKDEFEIAEKVVEFLGVEE